MSKIFDRSLAILADVLITNQQPTPLGGTSFNYIITFSLSPFHPTPEKKSGGDRSRTDDPLRARQVL